jgi:hypothetical protein
MSSLDHAAASTAEAGAETDLSCSVMGCAIVPLPMCRRVPWALPLQGLRAVHRPSATGEGLGSRFSLPRQAWVTTLSDSSTYGPTACSPSEGTLS